MKLQLITVIILSMILFACGNDKTSQTETSEESTKTESPTDPMLDKGIGPISSLVLATEVDAAMVSEGEKLFIAKCTACHKMGKRYIGPDLTGVTSRRTPEWIMNMILNPEEMLANNEIAKKLIAEYNAPMANQNLTEQEARNVLEYFRTIN